MGLRGTRCETSHHLPKCGGISIPLSLMRTLSRPTTHHSTDRCCVRVAGPIGCDYPNNRLSAPYRWRVPSLASTRQSSRMSADTCESRFPTTKPAPMRRHAHELSWLRWIAAGGLSDEPLRGFRRQSGLRHASITAVRTGVIVPTSFVVLVARFARIQEPTAGHYAAFSRHSAFSVHSSLILP